MCLERESRRFFRSSHLAQFVLRFGPGFDPAAFVNLIDRVHRQIPFLRSTVRPKWGGLFGPSVYHTGTSDRSAAIYHHSGTSVHRKPETRHFPKRFQQLLNRGPLNLSSDPIIRYDIVTGNDHTDIAFTWLFLLFDGRGITSFLRLLSRMSDDDLARPPINWSEELQSTVRLPGPLERLRIERNWADTMKQLADPSPGSLAGPLRKMPGRLRYRVHRFTKQEAAAADKQARKEAGALSPMLFYLAVSIRAHHRVFQLRSNVPDQYLVPVAVDLRTRTKISPIFRNHVSFLWFCVPPSPVTDRTELIDSLVKQKRSQIQSGFPRKMAIAMENNRYLPTAIGRRLLRSQTEGELCSFFFAFTGELFDGISALCGGRLQDGFPTAGVPPSPGSSFVWSRVHGRLHLTHLFQQGVVRPGEREAMQEQIRNDIPGTS